MRTPSSVRGGFTLIELAIVIVIIGLVLGGVLVGRSLVEASQVRAAIAQIDKYNQAVGAFQGKYGALPGDMNPLTAGQYGFAARGLFAGEGDGNGIIEGISANSNGANSGAYEGGGETVMFWVDLTTANGLNLSLIDGSFSTATPTSAAAYSTLSAVGNYMPVSKFGQSNYIYVFSQNNLNYFGMAAVSSVSTTSVTSAAKLTVSQAYNIDKKIDDGFPQSGAVLAQHLSSGVQWAPYPTGVAPGVVATGSTSTCYDNAGSVSNPMQYSLAVKGGASQTCALAFQFQ